MYPIMGRINHCVHLEFKIIENVFGGVRPRIIL